MRKLSKTVRGDQDAQAATRDDPRPRGVRGATITSWQGTPDIDLTSLFAQGRTAATLAGSGGGSSPPPGAMALSDGTEISFATPADFTEVILL